MGPSFTRDYREARLPLDKNALTMLQIVDLCSARLFDCSTPRQGALRADHRALYGLDETRGKYIQHGLRAFELTLLLAEHHWYERDRGEEKEDGSRHAGTEYVLKKIISHQKVVVSDFKDADDLSDRIKTQRR